MKRKYFRLITAAWLCFLLLVSNVGILAFYEPGAQTLSLGTIELQSGENQYSFYLPFDAAAINYTSDSAAEVTIKTGQQTVSLSNGSVTFPIIERKGERIWNITASANITLTDVSILQYDIPGYSELGKSANVCHISDEEYAISTAVLVHRDASCIIVGGARRYVDYENVKETPKVFDGSMYLPGRTLALALGCYYESIPDRNYVLLRDDSAGREFYFTTNGCYEQTELGAKENISFHPVYFEGEVYLPVRCFAELLGKTVGYKDGIAIIDDSYAVDKIMNTDVFTYVVSKFDEFTKADVIGKTYHVAQTENADDGNGNDGSAEKPYRTLAKAAEVAAAGDTVIIHKGTYRETLAPQTDGTAVSPITFKAAENERVVISATEIISGFEDAGNGQVSKAVSYNMGDGKNQIFYNGECITEARYPDGPVLEMSDNGEALSALFPVKGDLKVSVGVDRSLVTSDTLLTETEPDYWKGATFVSLHGSGYALGTAKVASSEKGKLNLTDFGTKWWVKDENPINNGWNFGYLSGHKNAINLPGEWVIADGKLVMIPPKDETAETLTVEMKARPTVLDLSKRKYIHIEGIETFGGGAKLNESEMCVLNGVDMKYISHYTWSDDQREGYIDDCSDAVRLSGNGAPQRGEVGVYISGKDNAVINSTIDHSAASGLYLAGLYAYIDNNKISNCGYMGSYVSGITAYTEPWTDFYAPRGGFSIYNNTVCNSGRYLFMIQANQYLWSNGGAAPFLPFEVAYNDFHDGILYTLDAGPVYAYWINASTDRQRSRIHSNYIYSTTPESNPYSFGLYCDGGSQGIDGYNNVIFTTEEGNRFTHGYVYRNPSLSTATLTNNTQLTNPIKGGRNALEAKHFPKGKPFYAGTLTDEPYLKNYEKSDETVNYIPAGDAVKYGNVTEAADGSIVLNDTDAYICFEDIDFSGGINQLHLYFGGDRYISKGDVVKIVMGDSASASDRMELPLIADSSRLHQLDFTGIDIGERTGTQNVYISIKTQNDAPRIYGIMLSDNANETDVHNYTDIKAIAYDAVYKMGTAGGLYTKVEGNYVRNTYPGTMLVYKNVEITEAVKYLAIVIGQDTEYVGRKVKIRIDSPTAEPIATYSVTASGWSDSTVKYQQLTKSLEIGTYDIYVEFTGSNTSNFFSFGLLPAIPEK